MIIISVFNFKIFRLRMFSVYRLPESYLLGQGLVWALLHFHQRQISRTIPGQHCTEMTVHGEPPTMKYKEILTFLFYCLFVVF